MTRISLGSRRRIGLYYIVRHAKSLLRSAVRRKPLGVALLVGLAATASAAPDPTSDVEDLRRRMDEMERRHEREIRELRSQLERRESPDDLHHAIDRLVERVAANEAQITAALPSRRNDVWFDVALNGLFAGGTSSASDEELELLQAGGHDPNRRGFTVQNLELILTGGVDEAFEAQANLIAFVDREGETVVELEEAFATTRALPFGLALKAGQFTTGFGRHNAEHPHLWQFVDQPVVHSRFFGPDGLRGQGAEIGWLPTETQPFSLTGALQNANGETMRSFAAVDEGDGHGHGAATTLGAARQREVRSLDDLVATTRAALDLELTEDWGASFGASAAFGPNSAGAGTDTRIRGLDLAAAWRPHDGGHDAPFVELRAELLDREYELDAFVDDDGDAFGRDTLRDSGLFVQATYGFLPAWTTGLRYGRFDGDSVAAGEFPGLDDRTRWSWQLTHSFSASSKLRLQVNRDDSDVVGDATSVWLQIEFHLGRHASHDDVTGHDHDH